MVRLENSFGSGRTSTMKPSSWRHSTMIWVSSLQRAPSSVTSPSASAARMSARFVMLLEPGTVISARTGLSSGTISISSGNDIPEKINHHSSLVTLRRIATVLNHAHLLRRHQAPPQHRVQHREERLDFLLAV